MEGWLKSFTFYCAIISLAFVLTFLFYLTNDATYLAQCIVVPAIIKALPRETLEIMTGNLLGDGGIHYPNLKRDGKPSGNPRYGMTMAAAVHNFISTLFTRVYAQYSTSTGLIS